MTRAATKLTKFYVQWCGSDCAGNPHDTREAAQKWIDDAHASCKRAGGGFYGSYAIVERAKPEQPR